MLRSKLPDVGVSIFSQMTALAQETGALNLAQGFPDYDPPLALREALARHALGPVTVEGPSLKAPVADGAASLTRFLAEVEGIELHDAGLRRPTLDEVFLTLTGKEDVR